MKLNGENIKKIIGIVFAAIIFSEIVQNIGVVVDFIKYILSVFMPFILGGAIAFILNVPMKKIESLLFRKSDKMKGAKRFLAFLITLTLGIFIISMALLVIVPEITNTIMQIAKQIPSAVNSAQEKLYELSDRFPQAREYIEKADLNWQDVAVQASSYLQSWGQNLLDSSMSIAGTIINGVTSFAIGFIFSIYALFQKEMLAEEVKSFLFAILPKSAAERTIYIIRLTCNTFSNFLSGQCIEAVILGTMFFVSMLICGMPYALLVGVLISIMALIPIVGSFVGCVIGFLLIVMVNPWQAVGFLVLFVVVVQIESNLIYPRVVGGSVGLPPIYILMAVTVGASLMGVLGMLIFIPLVSVCYTLLKEFVDKKLKEKHIKSEAIKKIEEKNNNNSPKTDYKKDNKNTYRNSNQNNNQNNNQKNNNMNKRVYYNRNNGGRNNGNGKKNNFKNKI